MTLLTTLFIIFTIHFLSIDSFPSTTVQYGTVKNNVCKDVGILNPFPLQCDNWHIYTLFLIDPHSKRESFPPIIDYLNQVLYSCNQEDLEKKHNMETDDNYPRNRFTYISVKETWTCNVTNCDLTDMVSLDDSKYPPSADKNLFTLFHDAILQSEVSPRNKATVFFVISNIPEEMFPHYGNITFLIDNAKQAGIDLAQLQIPLKLLWFGGESTDPLSDMVDSSDGWFKFYNFQSTANFSNYLQDLYICPVNGTYSIPTTTLLQTTTTAPPKGGKTGEWIAFLIVGLVILSIIVFCVLQRMCCPHWIPWHPILRLFARKIMGIEIHSDGSVRKNEERSATILSQVDFINITGIATTVLKRQSTVASASDIWEVTPINIFITDEKIGSGAFSQVFKGILRGKPPIMNSKCPLQISLSFNDRKNEVAVKLLSQHATKEARLAFLGEIKLMKRIGFHPNIVPLMGCLTKKENDDVILLTEYCRFGDLHKWLRMKKNTPEELTLREKKGIAWQICDALVYLSSRGYIHRDIAARNVFLIQRGFAKLGDFGLCVHNPDNITLKRGGKLPVRYMAPESLENMEFSEKSDVWTYAIFLSEMFSNGEIPFRGTPTEDILETIKNGTRPIRRENCPEELNKLMIDCWEYSTEHRPTFLEVKQRLFSIIDINSDEYGYLQFEEG